MRIEEMVEITIPKTKSAGMKAGPRNPGPAHKSILCASFMLAFICSAYAFETECSYYSVASCKREGTWQKWGGRMANGEMFADEKLVCASWDYRFGQKLRVTNKRNGRQVVVSVADRGPSKKLYKRGRRLDLSLGAFRAIEDPKRGLAQVMVEVI